MKKIGCISVLAIVGLALAAIMWGVGIYNNMVGLKEPATSQWANVESAYQKRADLVPNLVNTVKGYAEHEKGTLTEVIEARANATKINIDASNLTPENIAAFQSAQSGLSSSLSKLLATFEAYPDLKANENFMALQAELSSVENEIKFERQKFNTKVQEYNTYIKKAPQNIVANFTNFLEMGYFKAEQGSEKAPKVEF
ncbi:protein LemA [Flavobacteriaceae bacterium UJ101]|nr:protein LemA [Flavobacteriaceae bacterium UJ101]